MIFGSYGRHSIRFKFIIFSVVIQIVMLTLLVWNGIRLAQNSLTHQTELRIADLLPLLNSNIAAPLIQEDIASLNEILEQIVNKNRLRYILVKNTENEILAEKGVRSPDKYEHFTSSSRLFDILDHFVYRKKMPIKIDDYVAGELFFELNTKVTDTAIHEIRNQSVLIAIVAIFSTMFILTLLTFTLSRNLIKLTNAVKKYPNEDIKIEIPKNTKDEVGTLLTVIINMVKEIAVRDKKLGHYNYELEKTVLKRTVELEATNKELESFSYSISHDLRTPLRSISSFSTIILQDYEDKLDEAGIDYLNRIVTNTNHMGKLIDSLLLLSKTVKAPLNYSEINLTEIVRDSFNALLENEPNRQITLDVESDYIIHADSVLIRTVIDNLIGNSWKYTKKKDSATIRFGSLIINTETTFFIKDNGIGFNMEYADKLFVPFRRVHTNDDFAGSGIGLATVFRIIERHNGRIWFEAKENEGATFFFTLN